jgi:hypothetical protein
MFGAILISHFESNLVAFADGQYQGLEADKYTRKDADIT